MKILLFRSILHILKAHICLSLTNILAHSGVGDETEILKEYGYINNYIYIDFRLDIQRHNK